MCVPGLQMNTKMKKNNKNPKKGNAKPQSMRSANLWESMVTNPAMVEPVRTPSSCPYTGAVRTFMRTIEISSTGNDTPFDFIVRPSLRNTLALAGAAAPAGAQTDRWRGFLTANNNDRGGYFHSLRGSLSYYDSAGNLLCEQHSLVDAAENLDYFDIIQTATPTYRITVAGKMSKIQIWTRSAGVWTAGPAASTAPPAAIYNIAVASMDAIAITIQHPGVELYDTSLTYTSGVGFWSPSGPRLYSLFSTDAVRLGDVSTYRVTALSALVTYSGNMFNNGGVLAAARTRERYSYVDPSPYESLTRLQDHSYRGPLKEGGYVWWLPYSLEELDFRCPFDSEGGTELRVAGEFADETGALQVTLTAVVEFYSPLQIFEHEVGPPLTDAFVLAYHGLDLFPAALCNPSHTKTLSRAIRKAAAAAARLGKGVGSFLISHPEVAEELFAMLA